MQACSWTSQAGKPSGFSLLIAHFGQKKPTALIDAVSPFVVESVISFSDGNWAVTHARGSAEGSQGCREDAHDDLDNGLPSFFLHSALFLMVNVTDSIILSQIPRIYTAFSFIQPCLSKRAESGARRPRVWRQSASLKESRKWSPQASGLAPKCSRLRLYFGA